ncbi:uncharacterized protein LOC129760914 [Uranotaenia lowii]|uniref:uncharacterized protein LOC129760914 n=1 Tax=Uranotaenia lowii TaxID=190385 RepID=UPI002478E969|nr:uncharacterized protein LOC129760914 [Uranotaenia lowii]
MDPNGEHGPIQFLLLKPNSPAKLPTYPFIISKSVELAAGEIIGGHPCDQGQAYLLKVRSQKQVDKLLAVKNLIDSTPVTINFHPSLNTCKCVVTCREAAGATDEVLTQDLANQGVIGVHRFTRKVDGKTQPTNTLVLTLRGTTVPTHIRFGFIQAQTRPYYSRPMICLQCGKLGHTKKHCKNETACLNCGEEQTHPNCELPPNCVNCQDAHPSNSRSCPAYKEEQDIIRIRTDLGIPHNEAVKEYRKRQKQSTSLQQRLIQATTNPTIAEKDKEILGLRKLVDFLTAQITTLTNQVKKLELQKEKSPETSDSDASMTSDTSTVSIQNTPKRFWKTSSEDSPTGSDPKNGKPAEKRQKKKRQRKPENPTPPTIDLPLESTQQGKTATSTPPQQTGKSTKLPSNYYASTSYLK